MDKDFWFGLTEIIVRRITLDQLVTTDKAGDWCRLPYPGHKKGCPNYNKKKGCPPNAPKLLDVMKPRYLVAVKFAFREYIKRRKEQHPDWTDRQLKCVLYYQGRLNRTLREVCKMVIRHPRNYSGSAYDMCPEAGGIHVIMTCLNLGIPIDVKCEDYIYKVAIVGEKP